MSDPPFVCKKCRGRERCFCADDMAARQRATDLKLHHLQCVASAAATRRRRKRAVSVAPIKAMTK